MKENPKQLTRSEIRRFNKSRADATNATDEQLRHQMEVELNARQRVVDFLAGTKEGDSRFEYFKRLKASIMASATPFFFCTTQKHIAV